MQDHKVAIVTGAARGIGAGIVEGFLKNSYRVYAVDKEDVELRSNLSYHRTDLSQVDQISKIVKGCIQEFGRVDVLVNNAAVSLGKDFLTTDLETWEVSLAVNQTAPFFLAQAVAKEMIDKGIPGRIINVASVNSFAAEKGQSSYVVTKGAIALMTKSMAVDLGKFGILVNAIAPGPILTEKTEAIFTTEDYARAISNGIPLQRAGLPNEIADLVIFLSSASSTYITGQVIVVDGGYLSYCRLD